MIDLIAFQIAFVVIVLAFDLNPLEWVLLGILCRRRTFFTSWRGFDTIETKLAQFAERRRLVILLATLVPIAVRVLLLPIYPVPVPAITDEFSYLLAGDTFAHGRLANPPHPMWTHFESIHIIQQPTYSSQYLPAQGMVLALGQVLGNPWIGLLLSMGLMCGVVVWMLQQMLPARWALLGGAICAIHIGITSYWVNSYWGGCVAAIGGALAVGAYVNIEKRPTIKHSLLLVLGVALLANSRPFEGLIFCALLGGVLAWRLFRNRRITWGPVLGRLIIPATLALLTLGAGMAYFNFRVTGNPLKIPYAVNRETYGWPLTLPWFHTAAITHRHRQMRLYYEFESRILREKNSLWAQIVYFTLHVQILWRFFIGPALTIPLVFLRRAFHDRMMLLPAVLTVALFVVMMLEAGFPHYMAPVTGCIFALLVQCIRHLRVYRRNSDQLGLQLSRIVMVVVAITCIAHVIARAAHIPVMTGGNYLSSCCTPDEGMARVTAIRELLSVPGSHLVFVNYQRQEFYPREWVYNAADIDGSRIIWAQDMGPERNLELLRYYPNRRAWMAYPDRRPYRLAPYPPMPDVSAIPIQIVLGGPEKNREEGGVHK